MSDTSIFPIPENLTDNTWIDELGYARMYQESLADPARFWGEVGKRLHWMKPYTEVKDVDYHAPVRIRWYHDGTLNVAANCRDRHLPLRADETAIIWEGDSPHEHRHIS